VEDVRRVQRMVEEHGRLGAIARLDQEERRLAEIVAGYGTDEDVGIPSFLYSGWCLTALPHSRIPDEEPWELTNGNMTLLVEPGRRAKPGGGSEFVGVPFGATARLLLVYLQTQALCTKSRHVELGGSMRAWFERLEKVPGGKSYKMVRDQAERIAMAKFSFQSEKDGVRAVRNTTIVEEGLLFAEGPHDSRQQSLFREGVILSEAFFNAADPQQLARHRCLRLAGFQVEITEEADTDQLGIPACTVRPWLRAAGGIQEGFPESPQGRACRLSRSGTGRGRGNKGRPNPSSGESTNPRTGRVTKVQGLTN
jgi:hypothetical protein